jgi:hypothetical protein
LIPSSEHETKAPESAFGTGLMEIEMTAMPPRLPRLRRTSSIGSDGSVEGGQRSPLVPGRVSPAVGDGNRRRRLSRVLQDPVAFQNRSVSGDSSNSGTNSGSPSTRTASTASDPATPLPTIEALRQMSKASVSAADLTTLCEGAPFDRGERMASV